MFKGPSGINQIGTRLGLARLRLFVKGAGDLVVPVDDSH